MIVIQFFTRERRFHSYGLVVIFLQLISSIIGWQTYINEFILKSSFCTYYMIGRTVCPQFSNGYNNSERSYEYCYQFGEDCEGANQIKNIFLAAILLPLIFIFYICVLTGCFYWDYFKNYNSLKLSYFLWMVCFFICMVLFYVDADKIDSLSIKSSFQVNSNIRNSSFSIGVISTIQFAFLICTQYDLHQHIKFLQKQQSYQITVQLPSNPNNQQKIIPVVSYFDQQQQNIQIIQVQDNR